MAVAEWIFRLYNHDGTYSETNSFDDAQDWHIGGGRVTDATGDDWLKWPNDDTSDGDNQYLPMAVTGGRVGVVLSKPSKVTKSHGGARIVTPVLWDDFEHPDGTLLSAYSPNVGYSWTLPHIPDAPVTRAGYCQSVSLAGDQRANNVSVGGTGTKKIVAVHKGLGAGFAGAFCSHYMYFNRTSIADNGFIEANVYIDNVYDGGGDPTGAYIYSYGIILWRDSISGPTIIDQQFAALFPYTMGDTLTSELIVSAAGCTLNVNGSGTVTVTDAAITLFLFLEVSPDFFDTSVDPAYGLGMDDIKGYSF